MKHYTTDEYQQLIGMLEKKIDVGKKYDKFIIHLNGMGYIIAENSIFDYIFNATKINQLKKNSVLIKFLHSTPLKKVPLYMNKLPELCKWRLRIGK